MHIQYHHIYLPSYATTIETRQNVSPRWTGTRPESDAVVHD